MNNLKFASYGRKASGKTCLLAALSMAKVPNQNGYHATWTKIPSEHENDEEWVKAKDRLNTTREKILSGEPVPATDIMFGHDPFQFEFSTPEKEAFSIEFIDYSGELIDPDKDADTRVKALKNQIQSLDAIIVLIETPPEKENYNEDYEEVVKLNQAFSALTLKNVNEDSFFKINIPVCILITKFDRFYVPANPGQTVDKREIMNFLNTNRGKIIQNFITTLKSLTDDNFFEVFACSAYGESTKQRRQVDGKDSTFDRPITTHPLQSFGLEDSFVWAARTSVEQKFRKVSEATNRLNVFNFLTLSALSELSDKLIDLQRFSPEQKKPELLKIKQSLLKAKFAFFIWLIAFPLLAGLITELSFDYLSLQKIRSQFSKKNLTGNEIDWLESYTLSSPYRHFIFSNLIFSREDARDLLRGHFNILQKNKWDEIQETKDVSQKIVLIKDFVQKYPQSRFIASAEIDLNNALVVKDTAEYELRMAKDLDSIQHNIDICIRKSETSNLDFSEFSKIRQMLENAKNICRKNQAHLQKFAELQEKFAELINKNDQKKLQIEGLQKYSEIENLLVSESLLDWFEAGNQLLLFEEKVKSNSLLLEEWKMRAGKYLQAIEKNLVARLDSLRTNKDAETNLFDDFKKDLMAFEADGKFEQIARKLAIEGFQTSLLNIKVELDKAYYVLLYNFVREMSQAGLTKQVAEKKKILSYLAKMKTLAIEGVAGTQNSILILFESYIESVDAEHDVKICFEVSRDTETTKYIKAEKQWWDLTIDNEEKLKNYAVAAKSSFYKTVNLRKRLDEKLNVYVNVEVEEDWGIDDKYWGKDTYCIKDLAKNGAYLKLVYLPSYYGYLGIKCSGDNLVYPEIPVLKQK